MFNLFAKKQKRIYLDNAGATEISERAKRELSLTLKLYGNPSGIHKEGDTASRVLDVARNISATVLNAHSYEIYFVSSGTESCNTAITGTYLGAEEWATKNKVVPHIITSAIEHPSVLEPIRHLEKKGKVIVTYLPVYENGIIRLQDLREALSPSTILVSIMYANNEIGTIQPVKEIGRAIDEWKRENDRVFTSYPYFHTDACQAVNYCNVDVVRIKCHLMTVNSSKCYGPKGIAVLYKREGIRVDPIIYGGGQERGMRSGTENVALARSFAEALTETTELREREALRLREVRDYTVKELQQAIPDIILYGAFDERHPDGKIKQELRLPNNINCRIKGIGSDEMIIRLDQKGIAVSHKSACASSESDGSYVLEALGATEQESLENVRITMGRSTRKEEMKHLVATLKDIKEKFSH